MLRKDTRKCYVCGIDNPVGLHVAFEMDSAGRSVRGRFVPRTEHEGWTGIVHGGIIAALMDEAMVKLAALLGMPAVSAELSVRFRAPAAPGDDLVVTAIVAREARRLIEAEAKVERGPVVIAEAKGKLLRIETRGKEGRMVRR